VKLDSDLFEPFPSTKVGKIHKEGSRFHDRAQGPQKQNGSFSRSSRCNQIIDQKNPLPFLDAILVEFESS
jgi:hypothetical protein